MSRTVRIGFTCHSCDNQSNFGIKIGGPDDIYHGIVVECGECGEKEHMSQPDYDNIQRCKNA